MCYNLKIGVIMAKTNKNKSVQRKFAFVIAIMIVGAWLLATFMTFEQCVLGNHNAQANNLSARELSAQQVKYVGDSSFWVNFNRDDVTNISVNHIVLAGNEAEIGDKVSKAVVTNIENKAKLKFGKNYYLMGIVQFSIFENGERMTNFTDLSSVEMEISISGKANNAKDSYRAIFVKTSKATEDEIIRGSYDLINTVYDSAFSYENISCREEGKTGDLTNCLLTIDAHTDGFLLLMNIGNPKSSVGLIIMIVGIALSLVLFIVILQIFRSYKREKLRISTNRKYDASEIKDAPKQSGDTDSVDSDSVNANASKPSVTKVPAGVALPKKPSVIQKTAPKPKLPKK